MSRMSVTFIFRSKLKTFYIYIPCSFEKTILKEEEENIRENVQESNIWKSLKRFWKIILLSKLSDSLKSGDLSINPMACINGYAHTRILPLTAPGPQLKWWGRNRLSIVLNIAYSIPRVIPKIISTDKVFKTFLSFCKKGYISFN